MHSYIFRILENDGVYVTLVNNLIAKHHGSYTVLETKDGTIYETEFVSNENLEKFKEELAALIPF
jgi:hypothetical protein